MSGFIMPEICMFMLGALVCFLWLNSTGRLRGKRAERFVISSPCMLENEIHEEIKSTVEKWSKGEIPVLILDGGLTLERIKL